MLKLKKILLVACCVITSDAIAKKTAGLINTNGSLNSVFTKVTKKAQQAVTGMVVICSTAGLLSCAPIHLYEREGAVQNEQVETVEPVADWEWQEHEWGGRIAVSKHDGEVIGFDDEIRRIARQKLNNLNELAQDFAMKTKIFSRVRSYDPSWHLHFEEVSVVHDQLRAWVNVYGDNPKYYGFDPSFMENLRSALDNLTLNEIANTFDIEFGGRLLEGFDNFGWVFSKRHWPSQFGFSKEDIVWGLSGLDIAKFNSMRSQFQPYDYYGTVILYRTDDGSYHIGQALDQDESYPQLLKATSFFEDQQEKNISVDDIEGINVADDLVQPSHQLVGKFIEFPANTIVQVIHDGGDVITGRIEGYADTVFSNGYILAHTVDTHAEDTHHEAERRNTTFLLLKYEPTIKNMFDWDKILE